MKQRLMIARKFRTNFLAEGVVTAPLNLGSLSFHILDISIMGGIWVPAGNNGLGMM
jgi:hypothetical protein